jgi:serine/threonine-protein kinase HipA
MPANEHLSMQLARQVFGIETAENGLVFFKNGDPAFITKRFDVQEDGTKLAVEDFATLAGRTPQTHGTDFKYSGNYLQLFELLKKYVPAYPIEAIKLFKLLLFNYLISNGDAHFKNFSLIETALGDFKLSPAYDLLNSRIHIEDRDFALEDGLLPLDKSRGKVTEQFFQLAALAGISKRQYEKVFKSLTTNQDKLQSLVELSYLDEKTKRNYLQGYQTRLKKLLRD